MPPEVAVVVAFFALVVTSVTAFAIQQAKARRPQERAAAIQKLGLAAVNVTKDGGGRVVARGEVDGVAVELCDDGLGLTVHATTTTAVEIHGVPAPPERELGDPEFDRRATASGARGLALAALHARAREAVRRVVEDGSGSVEDGRVRRLTAGDAASILDTVRVCVAAAKALDDRAPGAATLLRNLREDESRGYRAACFHQLLAWHADKPELVDAARFLASNDDPLRTIARLVVSHEAAVSDTPAATLADALFRIPVDARAPLLQRLAAAGAPAEPVLLALLAKTEGPMLANATAGAHDAGALRDVFRAIGRAGTVASVERLKAHASGLLTDGSVKEAAREAIAEIQARAKGDVGGLSLAEPAATEGAVSLAGERGRVSVAEKKR